MAYKRILVPVDGSRTSTAGLEQAIGLAKGSRAALRLIYVLDSLPGFYVPGMGGALASIMESETRRARELLRKSEQLAASRGVKAESRLLDKAGGQAAAKIIADAQRWQADLIVMGTHGRRGLKRLVLGSDAELVLRKASVPVLLVRSRPDVRARADGIGPGSRILVPFDGSDASRAGFSEALALASESDASMRIIHVLEVRPMFGLPEGRIDFSALVEGMKKRGLALLEGCARRCRSRGVEATTALVDGEGSPVADVIVRNAERWKADLVVMGTHGRRGLNRILMGSDAELTVRGSLVPILLVHRR